MLSIYLQRTHTATSTHTRTTEGATGKTASFHCQEAIDYGTLMVGGVSPKKAGTTHLGMPIYATVAEVGVAGYLRERAGRDHSAALRSSLPGRPCSTMWWTFLADHGIYISRHVLAYLTLQLPHRR